MIFSRFHRLLFLIIFTGSVIVFQGCGQDKDSPLNDYSVLNPQKDFTLTDQNGNAFHLKDHRGQIVILFFGYISCPDVCPTALSKLARVYSLLGNSARQNILTVLVSVDPERDTPQKIKEYLEYFKINAVGLTGTKEEVDAVVNAYKVFYEKVDTKSEMGYFINHSDYLYLIDSEGIVRYLFQPDDKAEKMAKVIKKVLSK